MTIRTKPLLTELLRPLVGEWGREAVLAALKEFQVGGSLASDGASESGTRRDLEKHRSRNRPSAIQLAAKFGQDPAKRELLMLIAEKYDEKRFLPSVSDVREFLVMRGQGRRSIKDRSEAFRLFLEATKEIPLEQLRHFASSDVFSGPSQLAPLSDAIRASGEARRQELVQSADSESQPDLAASRAGSNQKVGNSE